MKKLFKIFQPILFFVATLTSVMVSTAAQAALEIEISGGSAQQIPIAIVPFGQGAAAGQDKIGDIVAADLRRSGLFRILETGGVASRPTELSQVKYAEWTVLQAQAITVGNVTALPGNRLKVTFGLADVLKQTQLVTMEYNIAPNQLRLTAHKIADVIYQKLTGEGPIFASRIAYINKTKNRFALQVADADGVNAQTVVSSSEPIISNVCLE